MRHRSGIVGVAAFAAMLCAWSAAAKEVFYPAAHPTVMMNVPDDWSVSETPLGLELQSPQKDALVLAAAVASDKRSLDDWSRRALERMQQEGVSFAKTGAAATSARGEAATKRFLSTAGPSSARPYTFSGIPSVDSPVAAAEQSEDIAVGSQAPGQPGGQDIPTISTIDPRAATTSALRVTGHYAYAGGKLNGQPVDVELAIFLLDKQQRLLVEQESGPTDARGVMIVRSVKAIPAAGK